MKESRSKPHFASFLPSIAILSAGAIMILLCDVVFKDWIIIAYSVRFFRGIHYLGIGTLGIGILDAILRIVMRALSNRAQRHERELEAAKAKQQSQMLSEYAEDSANPELTRKMLLQLCQETPTFGNLIDRCLNQMDRMDRLQAKQEILIMTNSALYLNDTVKVFDNVERRICRNFQNIINLCIAADGPDYLNQRRVDTILADNEQKLNNAKNLLDVSVAWINEYNQDSDHTDRSEVENWIAVIRESLKED